MSKPNILFIMTDQFRADALGCQSPWARTPHLDRVAAGGVRFANCVTNSPICVPARVCLASGMYCHNTGLWTNKGYTMPTDWPTWMAAIRDAGYRTSLFGKTHLHAHGGDVDLRDHEDKLHAYGLDDVDETTGPHAACRTTCRMTDSWERAGLLQAFRDDVKYRQWGRIISTHPSPLGLEHHYDTYVGQAAASYLRDYQRDEPWFCWVSFGGPHEPWDAPPPYDTMFDPADMPPPLPRIADAAPTRPQGHLDAHFAQQDKAFRDVHKLKLTDEQCRKMTANYAGNVALIDDQVGAILDVIEARGELDNTIIAFTSDHGEMNGDHGAIFKMNFLDGAARVPLVFSTPATRQSAVAGTVCDAPVELMDLGPTLAEAAGTTLDYEQFAVSLAPSLADSATRPREEAVCEFMGEVMMLTDAWKVALNRQGQVYLLVDRREDPGETTNLAGIPEHRATGDRLRLRLLERLAQDQRQQPICGLGGHH